MALFGRGKKNASKPTEEYKKIAQKSDDPKKLYDAVIHCSDAEIRLAALHRLGALKKSKKTEETIRNIISDTHREELKCEAALLLSGEEEKKRILKEYIETALRNIHSDCGFSCVEWCMHLEREEAVRLAAKAPRTGLLKELDARLNLNEEEWLYIARNTSGISDVSEAMSHLDLRYAKQLSEMAEQSGQPQRDEARKRLARLDPTKNEEYLCLLLLKDARLFDEYKDKLSQKAILYLLEHSLDNRYLFLQYLPYLTDEEAFARMILEHADGEIFEQFRAHSIKSGVVLNRMKNRQDLLTELLFTSRKHFPDTEIMKWIDDLKCLYRIAASGHSMSLIAAKKLPRDMLAQLCDEAVNASVRKYALQQVLGEKTASEWSDEECLKILRFNDHKQYAAAVNTMQAGEAFAAGTEIIGNKWKEYGTHTDTYKILTDTLIGLFEKNPSAEMAVDAFLKSPALYKDKEVIAALRKNIHDSEAEKRLIAETEEAFFSRERKWCDDDNGELSVAPKILALYDECDTGRAAWIHGGSRYVGYVMELLENCSESKQARVCINMLSQIYRQAPESAEMLEKHNGTVYQKHFDIQRSCADNSEDFMTEDILKL